MAVANAINPQFLGVPRVGAAVATKAGGDEVLDFGTTGIGLYFGSGAPTVSAVKGSLYIRTDGSSSSNRLYINTTGSTAWAAITTAS